MTQFAGEGVSQDAIIAHPLSMLKRNTRGMRSVSKSKSRANADIAVSELWRVKIAPL
jgi:hypothetical protein